MNNRSNLARSPPRTSLVFNGDDTFSFIFVRNSKNFLLRTALLFPCAAHKQTVCNTFVCAYLFAELKMSGENGQLCERAFTHRYKETERCINEDTYKLRHINV